MAEFFGPFWGFVDLLLPLPLIVPWVWICFGLAVLVGKKFIKKSLSHKIAGGVIVFFIALPLPTADEIAGRVYFNHLCKTEGGLKVYKTIELPAEYWDEDGKPKFYDDSNGNFTLPAGKFYKYRFEEATHLFDIKEARTFVLDINTREIIGKESLFRYRGGYISKSFRLSSNAVSCDSDWDEFVAKQFTKPLAKGGK